MLHALSRRAITCACYFELGLRTKPPLPITGMVVCSPNGLQLKAQKIAAASQGRRCGERGPLPALERGWQGKLLGVANADAYHPPVW
jgi:hypothetical protein